MHAEATAGGLDGLRNMVTVATTEADNAGGRGNFDALMYRVQAIHKKTDDITKQVWAIKKKVEEEGGASGSGGWAGGRG